MVLRVFSLVYNAFRIPIEAEDVVKSILTMRVYAAELICSTGVLGFQTFKPVFCIYNKLRLHAEMLS